MIVQRPCANCGKPLSPYWRDRCQHCGAPIAVAAPSYGAPPPVSAPPYGAAPPYPSASPAQPAVLVQAPAQMPGQVPVRVQNVLRGPTEAACLQLAAADAQQAAAHGYTPVWQGWGREGALLTLTVIYDLAAVAGATPVTAYTAAASPIVTPAPPVAQAQEPPASQPAQQWAPPAQAPAPAPVQQWTQAPAPAAQTQPWKQASTSAPGPAPAGQTPGRTISNRVIGGIVSIIVFIVAFLVYSALNRALY